MDTDLKHRGALLGKSTGIPQSVITSSRKDTMNATPKKRIADVALSKLWPHPAQRIYEDLSDFELNNLAIDMNTNGLNSYVEILPDYSIICGRQRVRAAKLLEWQRIRCWFRDDLHEQGAAAIEQRLLEDNFHRRQLDHLGIARVVARLIELRKGSIGELYQQLSDQFGLSERQLRRLVHMLDAPLEVQALYPSDLTADLVTRVADLPERVQQRIVERILAGEKPKKVVREFVERDVDTKSPGDQKVRKLVLYVAKKLPNVSVPDADVADDFWDNALETVDDAFKFFDELRRKIRRKTN